MMFVEQLRERIPFYDVRDCARPGLIGYAQVNYPYGSSEADVFHKVQYDLYYLKHRGWLMDLRIVFWRAWKILCYTEAIAKAEEQ